MCGLREAALCFCVISELRDGPGAPGASQTSVVLTKGLWNRDGISFLKQASAPAKGLCCLSQGRQLRM